ncbi:hypothetical protein ACU19_06295 [Actinobaculum suis]|uniref:DsbA family protein n=1 Tax=Actinobaculum suis TaxID=1657 RepID=UPI00066FDDC7|nr:thioredoxin domain-containing protein [Actinobaculum suis]KMY23067.1 hypothetical protein ACU19_06295 [Actinobaculum suis]
MRKTKIIALATIAGLSLSLTGCADTTRAGLQEASPAASATAAATPAAGETQTPASTEPVLIPKERTALAGVEMPANMDEYGGISFGKDLVAGTKNEGKPVVTIYSDPWCPYCVLLLDKYGERLTEMTKAEQITLVVQPNLRFAEYQFSPVAEQAELWMAANQPDKYFDYHTRLYHDVSMPFVVHDGEPIPRDKRDEPAVSRVYELASTVGVSDADIEKMKSDLASNPYRSLLEQLRQRFLDDGFKYVPTILVDGLHLENYKDGKFDTVLDEIAAGTWKK